MGQRNEEEAHCCHFGCEERAEFVIYGSSRHFEDTTEACVKHVGELLGTPAWLEENNTHWTVCLVGDSM
jgi:hypothetical protein